MKTSSLSLLLQPVLCLALVACGPDAKGTSVRPPKRMPGSARAASRSDGAPGGRSQAAYLEGGANLAAPTEPPPAAFAGLPLQESPTSFGELQAFQTSADLCTGSQGQWNAALLRCACPTGQVLMQNVGCQTAPKPHGGHGCEAPLAKLSAEQQASCLRSLDLGSLHLNLDLARLTAAKGRRLLRALDDPNAPLVAGFTLPARDANLLITLTNRLPATLANVAPQWLREDAFPEAQHIITPWEPQARSSNHTKACTEALTVSAGPEAKGLCSAATAARNALNGERAMRWPVNLFGDSAGDRQVITADAKVSKQQVQYRVHARQGFAVQRQLLITAASGARLQLLLSGRGDVDAASLTLANGARSFFDAHWIGIKTAPGSEATAAADAPAPQPVASADTDDADDSDDDGDSTQDS